MAIIHFLHASGAAYFVTVYFVVTMVHELDSKKLDANYLSGATPEELSIRYLQIGSK